MMINNAYIIRFKYVEFRYNNFDDNTDNLRPSVVGVNANPSSAHVSTAGNVQRKWPQIYARTA